MTVFPREVGKHHGSAFRVEHLLLNLLPKGGLHDQGGTREIRKENEETRRVLDGDLRDC